jgi:hypothetical protein
LGKVICRKNSLSAQFAFSNTAAKHVNHGLVAYQAFGEPALTPLIFLLSKNE